MPGRIPLLRRVVMALVLAISCGLGHVSARGAGCPCGTVADEFRAADAGLVREWIVQVPFDSASWRLEHVVVGDGLVIAQSGDGGVHAIRATGTAGARAGTVAWSRPVGSAAGQDWPPTIGTRLVVVASESAVHALNRDTGVMEWERTTDTLTAAAAVQSGGWVYTPLRSNRVLRLPVNPLGKPEVPEVSAAQAANRRRGGKTASVPQTAERLDPVSIDAGGEIDGAPLPIGNGVLWSTSNGLVALERTPTGWLRHELPQKPPPSWRPRKKMVLAGQPVVRDGSIFVISAGGDLVRIELNASNRTGLRAAWMTGLPDRPAAGPFVSGDFVVVSLDPAGVVAYAAADGRERWRDDLAGTILAVAGGRVWMLDEVGRLMALDLATGSRRQSFCLGCFTLPVVNTLTEQLVLASPGGVVVSLAPPPAPPVPKRPFTAGDRPRAEPAPADPEPTPP